MDNRVFEYPIQVRIIPKAKLSLDRVIAELRASGRITFRGKRITQEALLNASWLLMESLETDALEAALAPQFARLEAMVGYSDVDPGEEGDVAIDPGPAFRARNAKTDQRPRPPPEHREGRPLRPPPNLARRRLDGSRRRPRGRPPEASAPARPDGPGEAPAGSTGVARARSAHGAARPRRRAVRSARGTKPRPWRAAGAGRNGEHDVACGGRRQTGGVWTLRPRAPKSAAASRGTKSATRTRHPPP